MPLQLNSAPPKDPKTSSMYTIVRRYVPAIPALSRDQTNSHGCGAQHACTMGHCLIVTNSYLNNGY